MSCKKTTSLALVTLAVLAALAGGVYYCWTIRELPSARREACKQAAQKIKACKNDEVMTYLRGLAGDRRFTARFSNKFPWMRLSYETRVPIDFISQLAEDVFYRCAGRGTAETTDVPRMKDILAFSKEIFPLCSKEAQISLRERQVDACFFERSLKVVRESVCLCKQPDMRFGEQQVGKHYRAAVYIAAADIQQPGDIVE